MYKINDFTKIPKGTKVQIGSALALVGEGTANLSGLGCGELLKVVDLPRNVSFALKDKANKSYYEPSNCRFVTPAINMLNRRCNTPK